MPNVSRALSVAALGAILALGAVLTAADTVAPTVATPASATPSGMTVTLAVLGADDSGEPGLTYTWTAQGVYAAGTTFSVNGTNAAKASVATVPLAGNVRFACAIKDAANNQVVSIATATVSGLGRITRELWTGVGGTGVSSIPLDNTPSSRSELTTFEVPVSSPNVDNFGERIHGWLRPTATGTYNFWIASDDSSELWLSTDENPLNKVRVCYLSGWCNARQWTKSTTQKSANITLTAGKAYYIEALHKEGAGGDHLSVAWQGPGITQAVIPGTALESIGTGIIREYWSNYSGTTITDIPVLAALSGSQRLALGEGPTNTADNYAARYRAWFVPPVSGTWRFWIASDDSSELWLGTSATATATTATRIAYLTGSASARQWTKSTTQKSADRTLTAGTRYYIEALHKEGGGGDNLALACEGPGIAQTVIPGAFLMPYNPRNTAPTVGVSVVAAANPVTGTTVGLAALGADDHGEATVTYSWATTGTPPAAVVFNPSGTNAAKASTATFTKAGTYTIQCTIKDRTGQTVTSSTTLTVAQTATKLVVTPASTWVAPNGTAAFAASLKDQFGNAMATQPGITWTASDSQIISATGVFTAAATAGGPFTVTASDGTRTADAQVWSNTAPTITTAASATPNPVTGTSASLTVAASDDGGVTKLKYLWSVVGTPPYPVNLPSIAVMGNPAAAAVFTGIGSYTLRVTVSDLAGASITSDVAVTVNATPTTVVVTPGTMAANPGSSRTFSAVLNDQFGRAIASQPAFAWATTGGGTLNPTTGALAASTTAGGPYTVTATGGGKSGMATLTVGMATPIAHGQSLEVKTATATPITLTGSDPNGDALTWRIVTPPAHGTLTGTAPAVSYKSSTGWLGSDSFTFVVRDGSSDSAPATVSLTVVPATVSVVDASQSPLVMPAPFDAARWANDPAYRDWYVKNPEPGRIWQTAEPGPSVPILTTTMARRQVTTAYGTVNLSVTTAPNQPVNFLCFGGASLGLSTGQMITAAANAAGLATITVNAPGRGSATVRAASPAASGSISFIMAGE